MSSLDNKLLGVILVGTSVLAALYYWFVDIDETYSHDSGIMVRFKYDPDTGNFVGESIFDSQSGKKLDLPLTLDFTPIEHEGVKVGGQQSKATVTYTGNQKVDLSNVKVESVMDLHRVNIRPEGNIGNSTFITGPVMIR